MKRKITTSGSDQRKGYLYKQARLINLSMKLCFRSRIFTLFKHITVAGLSDTGFISHLLNLIKLFCPLTALPPPTAVRDRLSAPGVRQLHPAHPQVLQPEHHVLHQCQEQVERRLPLRSYSVVDQVTGGGLTQHLCVCAIAYACWTSPTAPSTRCLS